MPLGSITPDACKPTLRGVAWNPEPLCHSGDRAFLAQHLEHLGGVGHPTVRPGLRLLVSRVFGLIPQLQGFGGSARSFRRGLTLLGGVLGLKKERTSQHVKVDWRHITERQCTGRPRSHGYFGYAKAVRSDTDLKHDLRAICPVISIALRPDDGDLVFGQVATPAAGQPEDRVSLPHRAATDEHQARQGTLPLVRQHHTHTNALHERDRDQSGPGSCAAPARLGRRAARRPNPATRALPVGTRRLDEQSQVHLATAEPGRDDRVCCTDR